MMGVNLFLFCINKVTDLINLVKKKPSDMAKILIFFGLFVAVFAQNPYQQAYIVRYDNDNPGLGQYSFGFETSDGTRHDQTGQLINEGTEAEGVVMKGSYSYIGPDGITYTVHYTADENGFHPQGDHIPQAAGVNKLEGGPVASFPNPIIYG